MVINMSIYWNSRVRDISPYTPGEQPKRDGRLIKINTNENPYPPSEKVFEAIRSISGLQLYPDPECTAAVEAFAAVHSLKPSQVFAANGSDEALALSFLAFWDKSRPVIAPSLSYSFYPVYSQFFGVPLRKIPMLRQLEVDVEGICGETGGVCIANPNAPTSIALKNSEIIRILEAHPNDVVLVDEAYADFAGESAVGLIDSYRNLLIIRTLSKSYSLAGMRIGFAAGSEELIEGLNRAKNSFNSYTLDRVAIEAARAALCDREYFDKTVKKIIATRERTAAELRGLGFSLPDSSANFLFAAHPKYEAGELFLKLRAEGIIVRHFPSCEANNYLRISVGTDEEMDALISALREIIGNA
jgi:histidinol-phosphate aminotransferase